MKKVIVLFLIFLFIIKLHGLQHIVNLNNVYYSNFPVTVSNNSIISRVWQEHNDICDSTAIWNTFNKISINSNNATNISIGGPTTSGGNCFAVNSGNIQADYYDDIIFTNMLKKWNSGNRITDVKYSVYIYRTNISIGGPNHRLGFQWFDGSYNYTIDITTSILSNWTKVSAITEFSNVIINQKSAGIIIYYTNTTANDIIWYDDFLILVGHTNAQYISDPVDLGDNQTLEGISYYGIMPFGGVVVKTRSGDTISNCTNTSWSTHRTNGAAFTQSLGRYVQFKINFTNSIDMAGVQQITNVTINYSALKPGVIINSPADNSTNMYNLNINLSLNNLVSPGGNNDFIELQNLISSEKCIFELGELGFNKTITTSQNKIITFDMFTNKNSNIFNYTNVNNFSVKFIMADTNYTITNTLNNITIIPNYISSNLGGIAYSTNYKTKLTVLKNSINISGILALSNVSNVLTISALDNIKRSFNNSANVRWYVGTGVGKEQTIYLEKNKMLFDMYPVYENGYASFKIIETGKYALYTVTNYLTNNPGVLDNVNLVKKVGFDKIELKGYIDKPVIGTTDNFFNIIFKVYNIKGREIYNSTITNISSAVSYFWNFKLSDNKILPTGVYIIKLYPESKYLSGKKELLFIKTK